jgi:hypothetical protein
VTLQHVTALAANAVNDNYGLYNDSNATLVGGSFTGRGGTGFNSEAIGVYNDGNLDAEGIIALGENNGYINDGLSNDDNATLRGGSFTGLGGEYARGIANTDALEAHHVTAHGEFSIDFNIGFSSSGSGVAYLYGGSFTGKGGDRAYGISTYTGLLYAENVTALGMSGSNYTRGLSTGNNTVLRNSSFIARYGDNVAGIYLAYNNNLSAESIIAMAENGSSNYGFYNASTGLVYFGMSTLEGATSAVYRGTGTSMTLSHIHLIGGAVAGAGSATCTAVSRNAVFSANTCP